MNPRSLLPSSSSSNGAANPFVNFQTLLLIFLITSTDGFFVPSLHHRAQGGGRRGVQTSSLSSSSALHFLGRFRKKKTLEEIPPPISIGDALPAIDVEMLTMTSPVASKSTGNDNDAADTDADADPTVDGGGKITSIPISITEVMGTGTSILVGMPGAFTPVCTSEHLPGFIAASSKLMSLGVDTIAVVTTNDKFVNEVWARQVGLIFKESNSGSSTSGDGGGDGDSSSPILKPAITLLADGDAELVKAMGLVEDMGFGVGVRSKRFALICENCTVTTVLMDEESMDQCDMTSAANLIRILTPPEPDVAVAPDNDSLDQQQLMVALLGGGVLLVAVLAAMLLGGGGDDIQVSSVTASTVAAFPSTSNLVAFAQSGISSFQL